MCSMLANHARWLPAFNFSILGKGSAPLCVGIMMHVRTARRSPYESGGAWPTTPGRKAHKSGLGP